MQFSGGHPTRCLMRIRVPSPGNRVRGPCATACAVMLAGLLSLAGCISTQKFEQPPASLREAIRNGELVVPGQHVTIVSTSRGEQAFRVTEVDRNAIRGKDVEVPIEDIVALQTRRVDWLATAGVAVGYYALMGVGMLLVLTSY